MKPFGFLGRARASAVWLALRLTTGIGASLVALQLVNAQPANDNFANPFPLTGIGVNSSVTGSTVGATKETGEPDHAGNSSGQSVWYSWTATGAITVLITVKGTNFQPVFGVYTGSSVSDLATVAADDQNGYEPNESRVIISMAKGATYTIGVDGHPGTSGSFSLLISYLNYATPFNITTLAGNIDGFADGTGFDAYFNAPSGVAVDKAGNIYVADTYNHIIRKMTTTGDFGSGVVTTFAGSPGITGGTDGQGGSARFNYPNGLAVDEAGNIYVADWNNACVRKITPEGLVTTLAGLAGSFGQVDGTGSSARFGSVSAVAVDRAGNVYVTDIDNHTIRKITPDGVVTTLAGLAGSSGSANGTGSAARFRSPFALAVDNAANVYVADTDNHTIRKITPDGVVTTLAGLAGNTGATDGTGSAARFFKPAGVATDGLGNVFVSERRNQTLRMITPAGVVTTLAGRIQRASLRDGPGDVAQFNYPNQLTVDAASNIFVADTINSNMRLAAPPANVSVYSPAHTFTTIAGSTGSSGSADGTGSTARFSGSQGMAVDAAGNAYVADTANSVIRKITPGGGVSTLAGLAGVTGTDDGIGSVARFYSPEAVAVDSAGNVYVADTLAHTIRIITPDGNVTTLAGQALADGSADGTGSAARFFRPAGITVDEAGNVYVADTFNNTIRKITSGGVVTTLAGEAGSTGTADGTGVAARFNRPQGLGVDVAGNVYVADTLNHTVRKITSAGVVTTFAGSRGSSGGFDGTGIAASFNSPEAISVDAAGNVYVADTNNHTVRRITPAGVVSKVAGSAGNSGSADGTASFARFYYPHGVAVDAAGNLYVADRGNSTIRRGVPPWSVVTSPFTATATYGQPFSYTVTASGTPTGFSAANLPTWLTFNPASRVLSGTPDSAGSLSVNFSVTSATGSGSLALRLSVNPALADVTLGGLSQPYSGAPRAATVTTAPPGLVVDLTYDGSATAPTAPGSYAVVAVIREQNYTGTTSGTLSIQPNFGSFLAENFTPTQLADSAVSGPLASPARDGMANLLKYAFAVPPANIAAPSDWPVVGTSDGALTLTFVRRRDVTDLIYTVEVSGDMQTWESGPGRTQELSATPLDSQRELVVVRDLTPMSGSQRRFIRLKVSQP